jgi:PAS domain S-box-containing protein
MLMEHLPSAPFFIKDGGLRYVAANQAMADLCGAASGADMVGRCARDYFPDDIWPAFESLDRDVLQTARPVRDQLVRSANKDGSVAWILFTRWPIVTDAQAIGVAAIARNLSAPDKVGDTLGRLAPAIDFVQQNFTSPIEVGELARLVQLSVSQLDRDFVSLLGLSPLKYQKKLRIERAQQLLRDSELSVAEIAQACGYSDQSAFTRSFTSSLGRSPRAYRQSPG